MIKKEVINIQGFPINVEDDYICITDLAKAGKDEKRAASIIANWLRTRGTLEFIGTWEALYNPIFKVLEFEYFKKEAGLPTFTLSVSELVEKTDAIGIYSKQGKGGGTFAHKDIAFEFCTAISPVFKLYVIKEFQKLKEFESNSNNIDWNVRRLLSKNNYQIQTDSIKKYKIPISNLPYDKQYIAYTEEADLLNLALFGFTAKQWREANIELAAKGQNVREYASINELTILSTLEGMNADMIKSNIDKNERYLKLCDVAKEQLSVLEKINPQHTLRKNAEGNFSIPMGSDNRKMFPHKPTNIIEEVPHSFSKQLEGLLKVPPPNKDK